LRGGDVVLEGFEVTVIDHILSVQLIHQRQRLLQILRPPSTVLHGGAVLRNDAAGQLIVIQQLLEDAHCIDVDHERQQDGREHAPEARVILKALRGRCAEARELLRKIVDRTVDVLGPAARNRLADRGVGQPIGKLHHRHRRELVRLDEAANAVELFVVGLVAGDRVQEMLARLCQGDAAQQMRGARLQHFIEQSTHHDAEAFLAREQRAIGRLEDQGHDGREHQHDQRKCERSLQPLHGAPRRSRCAARRLLLPTHTIGCRAAAIGLTRYSATREYIDSNFSFAVQ